MKRVIIFILFTATMMAMITGNTGCANIVPPTGGDRDSLPPRLVKATPRDSSTNFQGKTITLQFDEYIDLQDVSSNLLFTPIFPVNPNVEVKLRTITVKLRDTLEANTTYTFNFGNAIRDINESNVLRGFTYTFSTGPALDSLTLTGKVILAETGGIDSTMIVVLHRDTDDSAVIKQAPRYATRLDGQGRFTFRNLPPGRFDVYALSEGGGRRYQNKTQLFGFLDTSVLVDGITAPLLLRAYRETVPAPRTSAPAAPNATDRRLRFSPSVADGGQQDIRKELTLTFDRPLKTLDTTEIRLTTDSAFTRVAFQTAMDSTRRKLSINTSWKEGAAYALLLGTGFAEDSAGRKLLRPDTLSFNAKKRSDYGQLRIRLRGIDSVRNPVLLFLQNGSVIDAVPVTGGIYSNPLFLPGEYDLRLLDDSNGNLKWDAGEFFITRRQPELVRPISRRITVKADWENDFEITVD